MPFHPGHFCFNCTQVKTLNKEQFVSIFKKIPDRAFYDIFSFYHLHAEYIQKLDFEDYLEIKYSYLVSLYHLDKYAHLQRHADDLLYRILNAEQYDDRMKSYYREILFLKAKAYAEEHKMEQAISMYKSLYLLNPGRKGLKRSLYILFFQKEYISRKKELSLVVFFLMISLLCNACTLFVVDPFFQDYSRLGNVIRDVLYLASFGSFSFIQVLNASKAYDALSKLRRDQKRNETAAVNKVLK